VVLSPSADWLTILEAYAHREYAATHNIQFPLLSDSDGQVSQAYGVLTEESEEHRSRLDEFVTLGIDQSHRPPC
jgi:peroxiredoxin